MYYQNFWQRVGPYSMVALLVLAFGLVGCDSGPDDGDGPTEVEGRVTNDQGYTSNLTAGGESPADASSRAFAQVEGAVVTAASVNAEGDMDRLDGSATTDVEGQYSLQLDESSNYLIVSAAESSFDSKVMVYARGASSVDAMPMTTESEWEADVYVEAKERDDDEVAMADVAAYVDAQASAAIESGSTTSAVIAAVIVEALRAEYHAAESADEEADDGDIKEQKESAFFDLQSDLHASSDTEANAVVYAFEEAFANAYLDAGASAETQAQAHQSGGATTVRLSGDADVSSDARFNLRQRAHIIAGAATGAALEARAEASGASQATVDAIGDARADLLASIRNATNMQAIASAQADFESDVKATLADELDVSVGALNTALDAAATSETTLSATLDLGVEVSGENVGEAYAAFYSAARSAIQAALTTAGAANADFGARALVMLQGYLYVD